MSNSGPVTTSRRKLRDIIEQQKKSKKKGIDLGIAKRLSRGSPSKKWRFVDEKVSKSGWLYRKDERHYPGEGGNAFIKVWAVIDYNTLTYYIDRPTSHDGIYGDPFSAGYITVKKGCRVLLEPDYSDIDVTTNAGLACFSIKEPDTHDSKGNLKKGVTATFSAVDDEIRNEWMVVLYKAADGFRHKSTKRMSMNSPSTERDSIQLVDDLESLNIDLDLDFGDDDDNNNNNNNNTNNNDINDEDEGDDYEIHPPTSSDNLSSSASNTKSQRISTADLANTRKLVETDFYGFKEPPKKIGCLRKKAIGGMLGFRPMKQRWFRLEAGELRYYDRPSMTPARLKNVLSLNKGATIEPLDPNRPLQIVINLGSHSESMNQRKSKGANLKLYAEDTEDAEEWHAAIFNTIDMYNNARELGNQQVNVKRKKNVRMLTVGDGVVGFQFGEYNFDGYDSTNSNNNTPIPDNDNDNNNNSSREKRTSQLRFSTIDSPQDRNSNSYNSNNNSITPDTSNISKKLPRKSSQGTVKAVSVEGLFSELTSCQLWDEAGSENSKPEILKALRSHFILSEMEEQGHLSILYNMKCIQLQPGDVATWEDTWGSNFYVIEWGSMEVFVKNNSESILNGGVAFGELALVNEVLRRGTLRAIVPTRLWFIDRANFRSLLSKEALRSQAMKVSTLKSIDIFKELLPSTIEKLAEALRVVVFDEINHRIVRQDDVGDDMFIIREGKVQVTRDNNVIVELGPGAFFGERALLKGTPRDATVSTITEFVSVYQLNRESFNLLVGSFSQCVDENFAIQVMNSLELMDGLNDIQKQNIASHFKKQIFPIESTIFKKDDFGDLFYIVVKGEASVILDDEEIAVISEGQYFGEQALLSTKASGLRNATVVVKGIEPLVCLSLQREDFTDLLGPIERFIEEEAEKRKILRKIEMLEEDQAEAVKSDMNTITNTNSYGDVDEVSTNDDNDSMNNDNSNRKRGSSNTSATSNIINSIGNFINRGSFAVNNDNNDNNNDEYDINGLDTRESVSIFHRTTVRKSRQGSLIGPSLLCCPMQLESLDDICVVETLGKGEFSTVSMVSIKDESINTFYACKRILKEDIANHMRVECVLNMKELSLDLAGGITTLNTIRKTASPFFPKLLATYQDHASIYFLSELVPGGDLHSVLYRADVLPRTELGGVPVAVAAFYVGSMLTALAHMHDRDIIYRNIRTENVLIDVTGHIRLCDLSLSKKLKNSISTTSTLCGCSEYLAPEILLSKPYNCAVDFWALGVFLYELLTATTPFEDITQAGTFHNILNSSYSLNRHMESLEKEKNTSFAGDAKDLIKGLVHHNPTMRLGMIHGGISTVWKHSMFTSLPGFQRKYFETMMMEAPYVPLNYLENESDIFGFQQFDEDDVEDFTFMDGKYQPYDGGVSFEGF